MILGSVKYFDIWEIPEGTFVFRNGK